LTEAATESKTDYMLDRKANLIMGHMIPGGLASSITRSSASSSKREAEDLLVIDFTKEEALIVGGIRGVIRKDLIKKTRYANKGSFFPMVYFYFSRN
jgi:hypothetical protein